MTKHSPAFKLAVSMVVCLSGCSGITGKETSHIKKVLFECERGGPALVRFHTEDELAELVYDGQVTELPQARSGSGFFYTNGKIGIRGKGDELLLEIGRMAPIQCQASGQQ